MEAGVGPGAALVEQVRQLPHRRRRDRVTWHETPIAIAGLTEGMEVSVGDAVVHDGALHLLVTLANRLDAVTVVQRVEL